MEDIQILFIDSNKNIHKNLNCKMDNSNVSSLIMKNNKNSSYNLY